MGGSNSDHHIRLLRGAVFEYLDGGLVDELVYDLRQILKDEEDRFKQQREVFKKARRILCGDKE